ncbi:MAG: FecR domain-containing protein [Bryobacteraceae bacterium]|nr:FecR domain-containing protein [Bryobacteraceae bacterium]
MPGKPAKVVGIDAAPVRAARPSFWMPSKWAVAAMLMMGIGVGSWKFWEWFGPAPTGNRARVLSADGSVYRLKGNAISPVGTGAEIEEGVVLRTAAGAHASVQLLDGSTVEIGERAELSVTATRRDTTVRLERGQIIVQAAKRSSGHLFVESPDSRVAVTGTIFSVNRGIAGSRVSVVEGEVHVEHGTAKDVLRPGDQVTTHASMARTAIKDEISWSRDYDKYLDVLQQLVDMKSKLSQIRMPGMRYSSRLLGNVPEGTVVYVSLPNLGRAIADMQQIVSDQTQQSPELQAWMQSQMSQFQRVTSQMSRIGEYVGDEIVFASRACKGFCGVLVAEAVKPGLKEYIDQEILNLGGAQKMGNIKILTVGNKVLIGENQETLDAVSKGESRFAQSPFGQSITGVYNRGAGLFVAADLESIFQDKVFEDEVAKGRPGSRFGFDKVRQFIAEQKEVNGQSEYSAVLTFAGERQGVASWLALPGAMGSLKFVSPDAQFASSFVVKQPAQMLSDAIGLADGKQVDLQEFERVFGVSLEQLASYLGGEITFAVDGPLVPIPSWKMVAEVKDPAGLQTAIVRLIEAGNTKLRNDKKPELALNQESANGRTWFSMKSPFDHVPMEIHYVYVDGYLLAAPNRTLLMKAIRDREAGTTLATSSEFRKMLPRDDRANFSGMIYQNAGDVMRLFAQTAGAATTGLTPEQSKRAEQLVNNFEATLICLYGEHDRIEMASQGAPANLLLKGFAAQLMNGLPQRSGTDTPKRSYR